MIRRTLLALALVGLGWAAGRAQTPAVSDFTVSVVTTQTGEVTIETRGDEGVEAQSGPSRS